MKKQKTNVLSFFEKTHFATFAEIVQIKKIYIQKMAEIRSKRSGLKLFLQRKNYDKTMNFFEKMKRSIVLTLTNTIYRVTQNITTKEKKEGREIYFLYSYSLGGGHKIFGQRTIKEVGIC